MTHVQNEMTKQCSLLKDFTVKGIWSRSIDISRQGSNARGDVPRGPDFRL